MGAGGGKFSVACVQNGAMIKQQSQGKQGKQVQKLK